MTTPDPSGVLVFDKPRGCTSHDLVARVRRTLGTRAVGHAGTLDPMATGVLVVVVGEATKLSPWLTADDKGYEATVELGVTTDTLDADGRVTEERPLPAPLVEALDALVRWDRCESGGGSPLLADALDRERARVSQRPPAVSAIQVGGQRAHALARRGAPPDLAERPVRAQRIELRAVTPEPWRCSFVLDVSKGYYVRAFARDLAEGLSTVGHLCALRRTRSGAFDLVDALGPDATAAEMHARMAPVALAATRALPSARLSEQGVRDARHGRSVQPAAITIDGDGAPPHPTSTPGAGPCAWLDAEGQLVAIGQQDETGSGRVIRGFASGAGPGERP
jgi:tRNA pseudouridine55 synthase